MKIHNSSTACFEGQQHSDADLNQEINDKLNELWTGMKDKKKSLMKNLNYSRKIDHSDLRASLSQMQEESTLTRVRGQLASEVSASKHKDTEIENLKKIINQLNNEKNMLINELTNQSNSSLSSKVLNESEINSLNKNADSRLNNRQKHTKFKPIVQQQVQQGIKQNSLNDLEKERLVELLRSTSQYRQFIYYYDSYQLSYLKRLQQQHRKNCEHNISLKQRQFWAPTDILRKMAELNESKKLGLSKFQIEHIISMVKHYYERNYQEKLDKIKNQFEAKLKKINRLNNNNIPYDLIQLSKIKERQLSKLAKRKRPISSILK